ncbi:VOC family protein [Bacillus sp. DX1.1]|uniref:VOC family protein n=1 Tax=unclassified Bacillus (in: firmicutes) TaxID=185979 RepID=UPI0025700D69|nr:MULTISPECIES: VOC family protein [unclassified Bacillus (in: firmicutes)]MDM5155579.1 VOC family protein [Bacillus sp. DX1.1]WJE79886.1 VOC family protein [Bacillus sp. DX3.1]
MIKPYLMFNRECEEAFKMYQKAFDGEMVAIQKYGDMPPNPEFPVNESDKNLVLHAHLKLTESGYIMGSDGNRDFQDSEKVCISVDLDSEERAINAWNILKEGGAIRNDLQPTFFSKLHGSVKDKYGVTWMFTVN